MISIYAYVAEAVIAFVMSEIITRGIVYPKGSGNEGIYVLHDGKYLRVHHYQLGIYIIIAGILLSYIFWFLAHFLYPAAAFLTALGFGVFLSGILDLVV